MSLFLCLLLTGCSPSQAPIVVITATPPPSLNAVVNVPPTAQSENPLATAIPTTASAPRATLAVASEYTVQVGDTLSAIAANNGVPLQSLIELNGIDDANLIAVGQVLALPEIPSEIGPDLPLLPDSKLVRGPDSMGFDIASFIAAQPGYLKNATDEVTTRLANGTGLDELLNAVQIVERVSLEYSVDPRMLLTLLEYRAGWLSNPTPRADLLDWPLISEAASGEIDRAGLYRQLSWAADRLNRGYYSWKYRGLDAITFEEGLRVRFVDSSTAGTIAVQYMLSQGDTNYQRWLFDVSENGLLRIYTRYFGNPFAGNTTSPIPLNLTQPLLTLPFEAGDIWRYTGGPHGGWGNGSAWASLDFAPPDERPEGGSFCYTSQAWITSVADGFVVRSSGGATVIDLDGDGDERTGWTINYLHLAEQIGAGLQVRAGDRIGRASCAGGFSTATHVHIGRRYNGEWVPANCASCRAGISVPDFVLDGWQAVGIAGQEYQGFLQNGAARVQAEQGRQTTINEISR